MSAVVLILGRSYFWGSLNSGAVLVLGLHCIEIVTCQALAQFPSPYVPSIFCRQFLHHGLPPADGEIFWCDVLCEVG